MQVRQGFMVEHRGNYRPAFEAVGDAGFDHVELNMGARFSRDAIDPPSVRTAAAENDLDVVVHLPFTVDIGSLHPEVRAGACGELEACIDVAAELEARRAVLHARSFGRPFHWDDELVVDALRASVQRLHEYAAERGVTACAENLEGDVIDVTDVPSLLTGTDASMCLDTGHAYGSGMDGSEQADFLQAHGDRIAHVHLNDTRRDGGDEHLPVGLGRIDFAELTAAMAETDWRGTCTHETLRFGDRFDDVLASAR